MGEGEEEEEEEEETEKKKEKDEKEKDEKKESKEGRQKKDTGKGGKSEEEEEEEEEDGVTNYWVRLLDYGAIYKVPQSQMMVLRKAKDFDFVTKVPFQAIFASFPRDLVVNREPEEEEEEKEKK